jgi:hypothetical protein
MGSASGDQVERSSLARVCTAGASIGTFATTVAGIRPCAMPSTLVAMLGKWAITESDPRTVAVSVATATLVSTCRGEYP